MDWNIPQEVSKHIITKSQNIKKNRGVVSGQEF
jgi:hypothetical protein